MKTIYRFLSIIITILMVTACGSDGSKETNNTDVNNNASDTLTSYDSATVVKDAADTSTNYPATFAVKAASGGMMEVELGTLAQQNAQNPRVKAFGAMMVKDHSKANKELMTIATSKTISIPGKVGEEHQNHIDEMKKLKGADFDKHYMDMMVNDHKEDIDLFETASKNIEDQDLKAFALKTLPILNMHLDSAKAINDAIK